MWEPPSSFELGPAVAGWAPHLRAGAQNPPHLLPTKRKGGEETSTAPDPPVCGHSRPTARLLEPPFQRKEQAHRGQVAPPRLYSW